MPDHPPTGLSSGTLPDPLPSTPWPLFKSWWDHAHAQRVQPNPNAMTLATIDPDGRPSARIVLCKAMDLESGWLVFHTNYNGRKGRALEANPRAALVFHWDSLDRQARIEGPVVRVTAAESDAYFKTRPWVSRVGAWSSEQSQPVPSRAAMIAQFDANLRRFGIDPAHPPSADAEIEIPRPPHWGGFRAWAERVELWIGGVGRLHDRASWTRTLGPIDRAGSTSSGWDVTRLQP